MILTSRRLISCTWLLKVERRVVLVLIDWSISRFGGVTNGIIEEILRIIFGMVVVLSEIGDILGWFCILVISRVFGWFISIRSAKNLFFFCFLVIFKLLNIKSLQLFFWVFSGFFFVNLWERPIIAIRILLLLGLHIALVLRVHLCMSSLIEAVVVHVLKSLILVIILLIENFLIIIKLLKLGLLGLVALIKLLLVWLTN